MSKNEKKWIIFLLKEKNKNKVTKSIFYCRNIFLSFDHVISVRRDFFFLKLEEKKDSPEAIIPAAIGKFD